LHGIQFVYTFETTRPATLPVRSAHPGGFSYFMQYRKLPLPIPDQIQLLQSRGLVIHDTVKAAHYLSVISYYRLRAYTYPFQNNSDPNHPFRVGVTFDQILDLYIFDRELRLLVLDAIERIEIALRTQIIYQMSLINGSHWHENISLFRNKGHFNRDTKKLQRELKRTSEVFIGHYYNKYSKPKHPPSWMSLEVVSLGFLSKMYENLKLSKEKKHVAHHFGIPHPFLLESWMHAFTNVRNICAHHSRLWNRKLTVIPKLPKNIKYTWLKGNIVSIHKPYVVFSCILYMMDRISPGHTWRDRFYALLKKYPDISTSEMGFPANWKKEALWQ